MTLDNDLVMEAQYTVNGALTDPTPAPQVTTASYPNGTLLGGLPLAMTHVRTGVYIATVFAAPLTLEGTYTATATTTSTSMDQYNGQVLYNWVDVGAESDPWATEIESGDYTLSQAGAILLDIQARTDLIGQSSYYINIPNVSTEEVTNLVPGDSYLYADGRAIFQQTTWFNAIDDLQTATLTLYASLGSGAATEFAGTSAGEQSAYVELTAAQSSKFALGQFFGQFKAVWTSDREQTLWEGQLRWSRNIS